MIALTAQSKVKIGRLGAVLPEDLDRGEWKAIWDQVQEMEGSLNWVIGDLINFAGKKYGETYAAAQSALGWKYDRIKKAAYVARAVPMGLRNHNLDWHHHVAVAGLPPQEQRRLLLKAQSNELSVGDLRAEVRVPAQAEALPKASEMIGFVPGAWVSEGMRWFRRQDFDDWSTARKDALLAQLRPLMDIYKALGGYQ